MVTAELVALCEPCAGPASQQTDNFHKPALCCCLVMHAALCRGSTWVTLLLFLLLCGMAAALLHYYQQPEALPYWALQNVQQLQQLPEVEQACRTGSFPLHEYACGWLHRVSQILVDGEAFTGLHDEL